MITPNYVQSSLPLPETKDKWYCFYGVSVAGFDQQFYRYLSPAGWKKTAYYFETEEEAEKTFERFSDYSFYPSVSEMEEERSMERLSKMMW